ncbi:TonB-dependent receptor [uncultured Paracoccus sp.]|uniref:TonB-dependent receptor n=1 Tax=uncultured Paracoccus sp. TaxID=189685 RepID=UPI0025D1F3FC|nr:TonB-dependent receptor [uncultured Paracoccus sp.]
MPRILPLFAASLAALGWAAPLQAQESETIVLDTVTIIGTGLPTEVRLNPASISVVEGEALRRSPPVSIARLLRDVPGVQVNEEGIERISIRGESSRRVAVLIDGQHLTDHTNYGQPVLVDPTTIERIEILRGSSSVVSGSRAIGGVINVITKKGAEKPLEVTATAGWMSATEGYRGSVSAAGTLDAGAGQFDYRLSYGRMDQGDRRTPNGVLRPSDVSDRNLSAHFGYRLDNHYFGLKAQRYDLAANVYVGQPDFLISLPHRDLRKYGLFYEGTNLTPWLDRLSADLYRQTIDRDFRNDVTATTPMGRMRVQSDSLDEQLTYGLNLRAEMAFTDNSRTVAGLEYEDDGLVANKTSLTTPPGAPFPRESLRRDDASIRTLSLFAQHEHELGNNLTATAGLRWYKVRADLHESVENGVANPTSDKSDSLLLGSAGLVWATDETLTLRGNISQGYVYPALGQLFLTTTGGGQTIIGNPDLDPERATTYELGARLDRGDTSVDATLFYTNARDYIATVLTGPIGTYENVDRAKSWGLELVAEHRLDSGLTPYASVVAMRRELEYANGYKTRDSGTPSLSGRIGLRQDWQWGEATGSLDVFLRGESAVEYRQADGMVASDAAGYGTLNMRGDVQFGNGLSLVAELNNLTDRSYAPYGQMPGAERSVNIFATYAF